MSVIEMPSLSSGLSRSRLVRSGSSDSLPQTSGSVAIATSPPESRGQSSRPRAVSSALSSDAPGATAVPRSLKLRANQKQHGPQRSPDHRSTLVKIRFPDSQSAREKTAWSDRSDACQKSLSMKWRSVIYFKIRPLEFPGGLLWDSRLSLLWPRFSPSCWELRSCPVGGFTNSNNNSSVKEG